MDTHPALICRLAAQLADAGIVTSQMGATGGATLALPAEKIALLDAYRVVVQQQTGRLLDAQEAARCKLRLRLTGGRCPPFFMVASISGVQPTSVCIHLMLADAFHLRPMHPDPVVQAEERAVKRFA